MRKLNVGDSVLVKNYHHGDKWLPGVIQKKTGPVSFVVVQFIVVIKIKCVDVSWRYPRTDL